jgi:DNA-binding MarR family transcriptional regulator
VTTNKFTKIVGTKTYINAETNELEELQMIKMEDRDFNFEKIWLAHILDSIDSIGNKKFQVVRYLLEKRSKNNNIIIGTIRDIAKKCNVCTQVVQRTISALLKADFMIRLQQGVYQINPDVIFRGRNNHRMNILIQYKKTKSEKS